MPLTETRQPPYCWADWRRNFVTWLIPHGFNPRVAENPKTLCPQRFHSFARSGAIAHYYRPPLPIRRGDFGRSGSGAAHWATGSAPAQPFALVAVGAHIAGLFRDRSLKIWVSGSVESGGFGFLVPRGAVEEPRAPTQVFGHVVDQAAAVGVVPMAHRAVPTPAHWRRFGLPTAHRVPQCRPDVNGTPVPPSRPGHESHLDRVKAAYVGGQCNLSDAPGSS